MIEFFKVITGLALFLFSVRAAHRAIDDSLASRFRRNYKNLFESQTAASISGLALAFILQSSTTAEVVMLILLARSLISFEQAFVFTLGTGLGAALSIWLNAQYTFFASSILLLIAVALPFLAFEWTPSRSVRRRYSELCYGLAFCSFAQFVVHDSFFPFAQNLLNGHLSHLSQSTSLLAYLASMVLGAVYAIGSLNIIQAGADVIQLSQELGLSFEAGTSTLLGAVIGGSAATLFACTTLNRKPLYLSFSSLLAKTLGVLMTLLLFRSFLTSGSYISQLFGVKDSLRNQLSASFVSYFFMNYLFWSFFHPILLVLVKRPYSVDTPGKKRFPKIVQSLLLQEPKRAISEAEDELIHILGNLKDISDFCFHFLATGSKVSSRLKGEAMVHYKLRETEYSIQNTQEFLLRLLAKTDEKDTEFLISIQSRLEMTSRLTRAWKLLNDLWKLIQGQILENKASVHQDTKKLFAEIHREFLPAWNAFYETAFHNKKPENNWENKLIQVTQGSDQDRMWLFEIRILLARLRNLMR